MNKDDFDISRIHERSVEEILEETRQIVEECLRDPRPAGPRACAEDMTNVVSLDLERKCRAVCGLSPKTRR